eukprot:CAMPEP_0114503770 /NCGR_PEP_ID=MMETSP0109-20121206/9831_1 /TAXON_ID=29199 /ORGANISM="Chlorarachnion reptans, Strain CCCM449" /LENGTH=253 /DNA_ID=CAMNT_0001681833 /DNA_START=540 /DNA_END=1299 /DNA_ORIENTATION=+
MLLADASRFAPPQVSAMQNVTGGKNRLIATGTKNPREYPRPVSPSRKPNAASGFSGCEKALGAPIAANAAQRGTAEVIQARASGVAGIFADATVVFPTMAAAPEADRRFEIANTALHKPMVDKYDPAHPTATTLSSLKPVSLLLLPELSQLSPAPPDLLSFPTRSRVGSMTRAGAKSIERCRDTQLIEAGSEEFEKPVGRRRGEARADHEPAASKHHPGDPRRESNPRAFEHLGEQGAPAPSNGKARHQPRAR